MPRAARIGGPGPSCQPENRRPVGAHRRDADADLRRPAVLTAYAITPHTPAMASTSASAAGTPTSSVRKRGVATAVDNTFRVIVVARTGTFGLAGTSGVGEGVRDAHRIACRARR